MSWKTRKLFLILIPCILFFALGAIVMWLWNAVLPQVTGCKSVNYWQAISILLLSKILFGGCHFGKSGKKRFFADKFSEKTFGFSEEDRQKLREEWRKRCSK